MDTRLLSGPIDADKMDYLVRDSLHAGVPYGRNFDQQRLIGSLCLNQAGDGVAISHKGRTAAEMLVFARYVMFSEVYWHHAVRSATAQAVHDNYASWRISLSNNEAALATSAKCFVDLTALSPAEKAQFVCTMMAFLSHSQNAFHQWREGHLSNGLWAGWEALMMNLVNTPGGADFWAERGYVFGAEFQNHVAVIMKRKPDPRARAFGVVPVTHVTERLAPSPRYTLLPTTPRQSKNATDARYSTS